MLVLSVVIALASSNFIGGLALECTNGAIRLVDGPTSYQGRVEVCLNQEWGSVCDSNWTTADASVACRQLGFSKYNAEAQDGSFYGTGSGRILVQNVGCIGSEAALLNCSNDSTIPCSRDNEVAVFCQVNLLCRENDIRLVGGQVDNEGRVEVCRNEEWGTVCDDHWSTVDAGVACRQLRYSRHNALARRSAYYGRGNGSIVMDNVGCTGRYWLEAKLTDCPFDTHTADCTHSQDAGVYCLTELQCQTGSVRLSYSTVPLEGTLEICSNETWHTLCDSCWDNNDAAVVCHQLGYSRIGARAFFNLHLGQDPRARVIINDFDCVGSESRLYECNFSRICAPNGCRRDDVAGVRCQPLQTCNFQVWISGVGVCRQWVSNRPQQKQDTVSREVILALNAQCSCGLTTTYISNSTWLCDSNQPSKAIFQAKLEGTQAVSCSQLVRYLQAWALQGQSIMVDGAQLQVDSSCAVSLTQFDTVECEPSSTTSEPTATTSATSEPRSLLIPLAAGIGGGLLGIVLLTVCCCLGCCLGRKSKRTSSGESAQGVTVEYSQHTTSWIIPNRLSFRRSAPQGPPPNYNDIAMEKI